MLEILSLPQGFCSTIGDSSLLLGRWVGTRGGWSFRGVGWYVVLCVGAVDCIVFFFFISFQLIVISIFCPYLILHLSQTTIVPSRFSSSLPIQRFPLLNCESSRLRRAKILQLVSRKLEMQLRCRERFSSPMHAKKKKVLVCTVLRVSGYKGDEELFFKSYFSGVWWKFKFSRHAEMGRGCAVPSVASGGGVRIRARVRRLSV